MPKGNRKAIRRANHPSVKSPKKPTIYAVDSSSEVTPVNESKTAMSKIFEIDGNQLAKGIVGLVIAQIVTKAVGVGWDAAANAIKNRKQ